MSSEVDLVRLALFLAATFGAGKVLGKLRISPILIYIAVGAILGPPLADFVPFPQATILVGLLGIQLSVMDAGLGTQLSEIKSFGFRAVLVAVLGVVFPISGACLVVCVVDVIEGNFDVSKSLKSSFAVGAAIAPTSLGVTASILAESDELFTSLGKLISVAAVVDDVISLILLAEIEAVANSDQSSSSNVWVLLQPIVFAFCFIIGGLLVALLLPSVLMYCFQTLKVSSSQRSKLAIWSLILLTIGMTFVAAKARTSFLLAGYLSGVAFASLPPDVMEDTWKDFASPYILSLSMIFFAGTIGFVIPLEELFSPQSLIIGMLLGIVAVVGKLLCGIGMLPRVVDGIAVAFAMLGRGEFGFLIAATARSLKLVSQRIYAATIWGVFIPTIIAPLVVGPILAWRKRRIHSEDESIHVSGL